MESIKKHLSYIPFYIICSLTISTIVIWSIALSASPDKLKVAFLDVGQGDSIFIETPSGTQVLIDGGYSSSVLREIGKLVPFFDRDIDIVIATHPDGDHIGGLISVLDRFEVDMVVESGNESDTDLYLDYREAVQDEDAVLILARKGMKIFLDENTYLSVLFPDRDAGGMESNSASVIVRLVYGETSVLLTGDSPDSIEEYITYMDPKSVKSTILKVGHHGSKTSSSPLFVSAVSPKYAIISAGENNRYGHPHQEVTQLFNDMEIVTFSTYEDGTIVFESDGKDIKRVK
ncbi:MAG: hypothetical protein COV70_04015 [Parcubacteria group bacterium CG11_big_fil_rev_8_21_14_0_20_39_22]|nr:MAG: hypothetical protein COV70_04015 [Parcubacteria group bacterium CG11_big_fil_rev_8_21_14_0_20_39_22]